MSDLLLIIEDNPDYSNTIKDYFEDQGWRVVLATRGEAGVRTALEQLPDAVILDLMLPDQPGLAVCRAMRDDPRTRDVPIVICSGLNRAHERIAGLEAGADDYVAKPISLRELSLRVRGCMRRTSARSAESYAGDTGALLVDPTAQRVWVGEAEVHLDAGEFSVLWTLLAERGAPVPVESLRVRMPEGGALTSAAAIARIVDGLRRKLAGTRAIDEPADGTYRLRSC